MSEKGQRDFHPAAGEEEVIPMAEPLDESAAAEEDTMEKFLRETKSGTAEAPEKFWGGGASGTTDEARDIGL